jgi:thiol:disulfide interchange protein DsbA
MLRRFLIVLLLSPLLACAKSQAPDTAELALAPPAADAAPAAATTDAPAVPTAADVAAAPTVASASSTPTAAAPVAPPQGPAPRPGIDYEVLSAPQPTWGQGRIEVAEVFGYPCIHCANLQPLVNEWHKTLPADVRFEYVPAAFGGPWDTFARGYFAAQLMNVDEKTHDAVFKAFHIEHSAGNGTEDDVAGLYARLGVDRDRFLSTMKSFGVTAKLDRARQFAQRAGVTGTPSIIVNGKYRVGSTRDRGFAGMLSTVDYLVALERAGQVAPSGAP